VKQVFRFSQFSADGESLAVASFYVPEKVKVERTGALCVQLGLVNDLCLTYRQELRMLIDGYMKLPLDDGWTPLYLLDAFLRVAFSDEKGTCDVRVYDIETGKEKLCADRAFFFRFSPDGRSIGISSHDNGFDSEVCLFKFRVFDIEIGKKKYSVTNRYAPYFLFEFSPNSRYVALYEGIRGSTDNNYKFKFFFLTVIDLVDQSLCKETECLDSAFSPQSKYLVLRKEKDEKFKLRIYDLDTCEKLRFRLNNVKSANYRITPNLKYVVIINEEDEKFKLRIYNIDTCGKLGFRLNNIESANYRITPNLEYVVINEAKNRTFKFFDIEIGEDVLFTEKDAKDCWNTKSNINNNYILLGYDFFWNCSSKCLVKVSKEKNLEDIDSSCFNHDGDCFYFNTNCFSHDDEYFCIANLIEKKLKLFDLIDKQIVDFDVFEKYILDTNKRFRILKTLDQGKPNQAIVESYILPKRQFKIDLEERVHDVKYKKFNDRWSNDLLVNIKYSDKKFSVPKSFFLKGI